MVHFSAKSRPRGVVTMVHISARSRPRGVWASCAQAWYMHCKAQSSAHQCTESTMGSSNKACTGLVQAWQGTEWCTSVRGINHGQQQQGVHRLGAGVARHRVVYIKARNRPQAAVTSCAQVWQGIHNQHC
eukprot:scaffold177233_cov25-Tisochrysis_lutea.AAC.2